MEADSCGSDSTRNGNISASLRFLAGAFKPVEEEIKIVLGEGCKRLWLKLMRVETKER